MSEDRLSGYLEHALPEVGESLRRYARETGKSVNETLWRKGVDLRWRMYRGYRRLRPDRGEIRADARARGYRVRVRPSITAAYRGRSAVRRGGRALNWRAQAVRRELAVRSSGAGFLSIPFLHRQFRGGDTPRSAEFTERTRKGRRRDIGRARVRLRERDSSVLLSGWAEGQREVGQRRGVIGGALRGMERDTAAYLERRQGRAAGRTIRRRYAAQRRAAR